MERTLISWNVPNMITVPLMAILGFLLVATVAQFIKRGMSNSGRTFGSPAGGSTDTSAATGY